MLPSDTCLPLSCHISPNDLRSAAAQPTRRRLLVAFSPPSPGDECWVRERLDDCCSVLTSSPRSEYRCLSRVLIIYEDGLFVLWEIQESKSIFKGGNALQSAHNERKKVTSACWACPLGSKAVIGYSTGDIFIWSVPIPNGKSELVPDI
ncbi:hypothetical protein BT93_C0729 [Corymbia citriodora subsp. variegata]|nr:hypothetical protein BT93_C0729 [Corymbia citriodora subsp. variegata]